MVRGVAPTHWQARVRTKTPGRPHFVAAARPPQHDPALAPLADPWDVQPAAVDADGHNAKHGYGRLHATFACAAARDPIAHALVAMGETAAALAYLDGGATLRPYTRRLARWMSRALLGDAALDHALRAALRHLRLVTARPERAKAHAPGSLLRAVLVLVRALESSSTPRSARVTHDLSELRRRLSTFDEQKLLAAAAAVVGAAPTAEAGGFTSQRPAA